MSYDIYDAESGLKVMASRAAYVDGCEERVRDARAQLVSLEGALANARKSFDEAREQTMEFCPALAEGYGATKPTETVMIVDGKVTVVPIEGAGA